MRRMLEYGAQILSESGVRVLNCSPVSDLDCFEKATYEDAVSR